MSYVHLRPALKSDSADLALLDNIAGFGLSHWLWQRLGNTDRVEQAYVYGREKFTDDSSPHGWKSATVAIENDMIIGMATSYIMPTPDKDEYTALKQMAPVFAPVFELHEYVAGNWYLDAIATYPQARGKGIGSMLMDDSLIKGRHIGAKKISLVAEDCNKNAVAFYKSRGFVLVASRPMVDFEYVNGSKNWLLMTAEL